MLLGQLRFLMEWAETILAQKRINPRKKKFLDPTFYILNGRVIHFHAQLGLKSDSRVMETSRSYSPRPTPVSRKRGRKSGYAPVF